MEALINQIESLGLIQVKGKRSRTMVHKFVAPNGDIYATYSSGYVRRIFQSVSYFSKIERTHMYQLNKRTKIGFNHSRDLIPTEEGRLLRLYECYKRSRLR